MSLRSHETLRQRRRGGFHLQPRVLVPDSDPAHTFKDRPLKDLTSCQPAHCFYSLLMFSSPSSTSFPSFLLLLLPQRFKCVRGKIGQVCAHTNSLLTLDSLLHFFLFYFFSGATECFDISIVFHFLFITLEASSSVPSTGCCSRACCYQLMHHLDVGFYLFFSFFCFFRKRHVCFFCVLVYGLFCFFVFFV